MITEVALLHRKITMIPALSIIHSKEFLHIANLKLQNQLAAKVCSTVSDNWSMDCNGTLHKKV